MTDIQIQNQTSNFNTSKKEFENRFDDKALRNLCVKNIPKETKENELFEIFQPFGLIESIKLKVNKNVGPYAIYAHVLFSTPEEAKRCLKQMNGKILNGRALRIDYKRKKNPGDNPENNNFNNYNNNKFHRKINRTNQFHNNRYNNNNNNNNKRNIRNTNDGLMNDDINSQYDSENSNLIDYEQMNKRPRIGNMNDIKSGNINSSLELNRLIKDYSEKKMLNQLPNDHTINEAEEIIQTLLNNMMNNKPARIKLYLCDHLRTCAKHVFNRPSIYTSNNNGMETSKNQNIYQNNNNNNNEPILYNSSDKINNNDMSLKNQDMFSSPQEKNIHNNKPIITGNNNEYIWKGILSMKNKENLNIIGHALQGNVNIFLNGHITNIVISHRKRMKSIPQMEAIYYFEIENKQDENIFSSYKNYFNTKDRVGLVSTNENWHLYIIFPGSPIFNQFCNNNNLNNIFIGIVCYNPQVVDKKNPLTFSGQNMDTLNNYNQADFSGNNNIMKGGQDLYNNPNNPSFQINSLNINEKQNNNINNFNVAEISNFNNQNKNHTNSQYEQNAREEKNSTYNSMSDNTKEENKSDVPNWLNQFSSLAAYLVKK
ncbi:putative RNA-binding protein [Plasmodium gaboni]|uniref:Putative RNA-binding protein n=1 Tax=Plasmodium gaboni TaxID=647221 RepID=A0A151LAU4_9APIC|nr:putative RNA-binding protein [Plasmodium gaboni]KYN96049.1 putative RNA-binding protein [Plasmodium gaboni]